MMQDSEPDIIDGVGAEAGHVIRTTVGGRGGQPKQVWWMLICGDYSIYLISNVTDFTAFVSAELLTLAYVIYWNWQVISYIAEHVIGTGSFGVVFQVGATHYFLYHMLHLPFSLHLCCY